MKKDKVKFKTSWVNRFDYCIHSFWYSSYSENDTSDMEGWLNLKEGWDILITNTDCDEYEDYDE